MCHINSIKNPYLTAFCLANNNLVLEEGKNPCSPFAELLKMKDMGVPLTEMNVISPDEIRDDNLYTEYITAPGEGFVIYAMNKDIHGIRNYFS